MNYDVSKQIRDGMEGSLQFSIGVNDALAQALRQTQTVFNWAKVMEPLSEQWAAAFNRPFKEIAAQAGLFREFSRSLEKSFAPMQEMMKRLGPHVEGMTSITLPLEARLDMSKLAVVHLDLFTPQMSEAIKRAMTMPSILQSTQFATLAELMQREGAFRRTFMQEIGARRRCHSGE